MPKEIKVKLNEKDLTKVIKEVRNFKDKILNRIPEFVQKLAEEGLMVARVGYQTAQYDGTNDVTVMITQESRYSRSVVAIGSAVLFIEFGTGVNYPSNHPDPIASSFPRGEYGHKRGSNVWGWSYRGDAGTNGQVTKNGRIWTIGNPSNACLYNSKKHVESIIQKTAREVFK